MQTFRARTLREAIAQVRSAYGTDAALLHTREIDPGFWGRLFRGPLVEVVARAIEREATEQETAQASPETQESLSEATLNRALAALTERGVEPLVARRLIDRARRELPPAVLTEPVLLEEFLAAAQREHGMNPTRGVAPIADAA